MKKDENRQYFQSCIRRWKYQLEIVFVPQKIGLTESEIWESSTLGESWNKGSNDSALGRHVSLTRGPNEKGRRKRGAADMEPWAAPAFEDRQIKRSLPRRLVSENEKTSRASPWNGSDNNFNCKKFSELRIEICPLDLSMAGSLGMSEKGVQMESKGLGSNWEIN